MNALKKTTLIVLACSSILICMSTQSQETSICMLEGAPPSEYRYQVIRKLVIGKGSYGSVSDIQPGFSKMAKNAGAEAVIYYHGRQKFGFWPWRIVRPVITGTAIKWDAGNAKPFPCTEHGGFYL